MRATMVPRNDSTAHPVAAAAAPGPNEARPAAGLYPPISDYAIIGDCRTSALISRQGAVEWFCAPAVSSPSVFAAILDREHGGCLSLRPTEVRSVDRQYLERSCILETAFTTATGRVRILDLMPIIVEPWSDRQLEANREILRIVECTEGEATVWLHYQPRPDYGRQQPRLDPRGRLGLACMQDGNLFMLHTDIPTTLSDDRTEAGGFVTLRAGERRYVSFTVASGEIGIVPPLGENADRRLSLTLDWWRSWCQRNRYEGRYQNAVQRSAMTLKLMTYAPSGALVGAPTTSLPEAIGSRLNWDYRYCWPRDAGQTLRTLVDLGYAGEARAFLGWLLHATRVTRPRLLPLYDVYGRPVPKEKRLNHLEGYRASVPVNIGNGARNQLQLDVYGSVILAAADYVERGGDIGSAERKLLRSFGDQVCRCWKEPDHGIWEVRGRRRQHTFSKVMCWVALDRLIYLHQKHALRINANRIAEQRNAIHDAIETQAWNPSLKAYAGEFGGDWLDAALLLMPRFGYIDANHPRMRSTLRAIDQHLDQNGLLRRFAIHPQEPRTPEGAFTICNFWRIDCLVRQGDLGRARVLFERILHTVNDVGLLSEEIDPDTDQLLGNFPQALSHIGLISAAQALRAAEHKDPSAEKSREASHAGRPVSDD